MSFGLRHTLLDREGWHRQRRSLTRVFGMRPDAPPRSPAQRFATEMAAKLLIPDRTPIRVLLVDLSQTGARLKLNCPLHAGTLMRLAFPSFRTKHVRVAWGNDGEAGLEFLSPLSEESVQALAGIPGTTDD